MYVSDRANAKKTMGREEIREHGEVIWNPEDDGSKFLTVATAVNAGNMEVMKF
ncbi:hypothetical protein J21TS3_40750 [Paenibacillus cookii]|uniref:Uncharacterized protein n=1 Tax=Paenibacillus cookii TaxID=157839 RepID=A0ABQ4M1D4_9BACL|nr:hypothetical protein J21TS3_40750 [Paenibacillus cookii]